MFIYQSQKNMFIYLSPCFLSSSALATHTPVSRVARLRLSIPWDKWGVLNIIYAILRAAAYARATALVQHDTSSYDDKFSNKADVTIKQRWRHDR